MGKKERKVLLIANEQEICKKLGNVIHEKFKFEVEIAGEGKKAMEMLERTPWNYDVAVIYDDLKSETATRGVLKEIKKKYLEMEVISVIGSDEKTVSYPLHEGAFGCFFQPFNFEGIAYAVKFAREKAQFRRERKILDNLREITLAINSTTEPRDILRLTCKAAVEIFEVHHSVLVLFGKDLLMGKVIAQHPRLDAIKKLEIKVKGIPLEEELVKERSIINIYDVPRFKSLPNVYKVLKEMNVKSMLIMPVILNNQVVASFSLDMMDEHRIFFPDEIDLCGKLANQAAIAIEKAQRAKELSVLNEIGNAISDTDPRKQDVKKVLEIIRDQAGRLINVTNFFIALYDEEKKEYSFPLFIDMEEQGTANWPPKMGKSLTDYVRQRKEPILVDRALNKKLIEEGTIELIGAPALVWLGAPLIVRQKVLGVMVVQSYENEDAYDEHDLKILQTIASRAAIAIDNIRLFKDAHRRIQDLEVVNHIVQIISTKLDTDDLLQTMVMQISEKLKCSHCTLFSPESVEGRYLLVPKTSVGKDSEKVLDRLFELDEGLVGWVFQNGQSLVLGDASTDKRFAPARKRKKLPHSMLVVPLKVGKRTIGVICAEQDKNNWFSESDKQLVDALTMHAGIAIERAIGLNLLQEIGSQIIGAEDEDKILRRIVTGAINLIGAASGIIFLISDDGKSIDKSFPYPPDIEHPEPRMENEKGLTRQVIDKGKMITVSDIENNECVNRDLLEKNVRSLIALPLKRGKKVVGVLFLNCGESRSFSEIECSLLEILASHAAFAISNALHYQYSQRQLTEIHTLHEMSQEIAKSMDIKTLLDTILRSALKLASADSAQVIFPDKARNRLKIALTYGGDDLKRVPFKIGEGLTSKVFNSGISDYTNDYHNHPDRLRELDEPPYRDLFNSLAVVPLKWQDEVKGVIALTAKAYGNFTPHDIQLLERFSISAAIKLSLVRESAFRQAILANSPDAIVAIDRSGIVKEFNKAAEEILGYEENELPGHSVVDVWGDLEESKRIKSWMRESADGTVRRREAVVISKSGERIPVLFSGSLLYSEGFGDEKEEIGSIGHIEDQRIVSFEGRTKRLFEAIKKINRSDELPKLLKVIIEYATCILDADSGCIMLEKNADFRMIEAREMDEETIDKIDIFIEDETFKVILEQGNPKALSGSQPPLLIPGKGKSILILPLKIEDKIIGSIWLLSHVKDYFREEDELLQILSGEAAVAINRVQLKEKSEQLEWLKEIGDKIRVIGEFEEYKELIAQISRRLLRAEISSIFLYDKSNRCLRRETRYPKFESLGNLDEAYYDTHTGITGQVLACQEGNTEYILYPDEIKIWADALSEHLERYKSLPSWRERSGSKSPVKHCLVVPIYGEKGKVFGAIRVMNRVTKGYSFESPILEEDGFRNPEDVKLLKTIASLLSQALSSERKAGKLKVLREITAEIAMQDKTRGIGDCLVKSVVERLGYSACSMRLLRGDNLELISDAGFELSSAALKTIEVKKDKGLVGRSIKTNKAVFALDLLSDDEELNGGYINRDFAERGNFRSACCIPIEGRKDETIGVITIYMRKAPYTFLDYEVRDNFYPIAATCSIALRKVQAVDHFQKLVELLGLVHMANSRLEVIEGCIKEMLGIFDAHSAIVYDTKKQPGVDRAVMEKMTFDPIYIKNIDIYFEVPPGLLAKINKDDPGTFNAAEFPDQWQALKKQYSQCLIFALNFQEEIVGLVVLFTEVGIPFILHEVDRFNLASSIGRQLAIAFKNIEITEEMERMRVSQPAIMSAQYVSGMIHELNATANKGKLAVTSIRNSDEYEKIKSRNWKLDMAKVESAFDNIGIFTTRALELNRTARATFRRTLEYRSINDAIRDVIHDCSHEARRKRVWIDWKNDKNHERKHAYFDEIMIKQAIRNLISNSIRWLPESGTGKINIVSRQKGDYISVIVEDNGPGIKPGDEKSIFDPFFTTSHKGYGVGLFFVRNVVKAHEGEVNLVSPRDPTRFEIKISGKLKKGGTAK
jgi:PAS domain S-box-containing protein